VIACIRNEFERSIAEQIEATEGCAAYEIESVPYTTHRGETRNYYPDFRLHNGLLIEAKGFFRLNDRRKHKRIREQHPELDIRIVFQNADTKISGGSATTYAQWCKRHGIRWAHRDIPIAWFNE